MERNFKILVLCSLLCALESAHVPETNLKSTSTVSSKVTVYACSGVQHSPNLDSGNANAPHSNRNCSNDVFVKGAERSQVEVWKSNVIIVCTVTAAVEIVIVVVIVLYWKQIRWTLRKIKCPCDESQRSSESRGRWWQRRSRHDTNARTDRTSYDVNVTTSLVVNEDHASTSASGSEVPALNRTTQTIVPTSQSISSDMDIQQSGNSTVQEPLYSSEDCVRSKRRDPLMNNDCQYADKIDEDTRKEIRELSTHINRLNGQEISEVLQIICRNEESFQDADPDEIEIDFEVLKPSTLQKLDDYVRRTLKSRGVSTWDES